MIPLLCFGGAATRIPLSTLGLMQYLTPTVQFLLGILFFHEPMPAMRWVGFALIWFALVLFTASTLRQPPAAAAGPPGGEGLRLSAGWMGRWRSSICGPPAPA